MAPDSGPHSSTGGHVDPSAWGEMLAGAYRKVSERVMRDLPIFNDALAVEAVGFRRIDGTIIGVVVTPWFMNVVTPADDGAMRSAPAGSNVRLRFPAGNIEFTISEVAAAGRIASCSLFSPMFCFSDMSSARATAEAALDALMVPADREETADRRGHTGSIDRRNFLRGVLTERRA